MARVGMEGGIGLERGAIVSRLQLREEHGDGGEGRRPAAESSALARPRPTVSDEGLRGSSWLALTARTRIVLMASRSTSVYPMAAIGQFGRSRVQWTGLVAAADCRFGRIRESRGRISTTLFAGVRWVWEVLFRSHRRLRSVLRCDTFCPKVGFWHSSAATASALSQGDCAATHLLVPTLPTEYRT